MQTRIDPSYQSTRDGQRAEKILRSCVHCGFCTATCPTYQLSGDELDSPRGRIYLIKQMLEGQPVSAKTQLHLDRCLHCQSCETTCPSGVNYSQLLEIGHRLVNEKIERPLLNRLYRHLLCAVLPYRQRFAFVLNFARLFRFLLPTELKRRIPDAAGHQPWADKTLPRKMLVLDGCVQPSLRPHINAATSRVLEKLGIQLIPMPQARCCGAIHQHMDRATDARAFIRQNIDAWYPLIASAEAEAIVITASGCGAMVKDYARLLHDDPAYAEKAETISRACKDISEVLQNENLEKLNLVPQTVSFHSPCTLQHAQKLNGVVEGILRRAGFRLNTINDAHLCCGSAGTYSLLQPEISQQLRQNKLQSLEQDSPPIIATANIGCLHHLASGTRTKVVHWIELLDQ